MNNVDVGGEVSIGGFLASVADAVAAAAICVTAI